GVIRKKAASNSSMSFSTARAFTNSGFRTLAGSTPASTISRSVKNEIDSTPSDRLRQNSSTFATPGKRPAMPMTAIPELLLLSSNIEICAFLWPRSGPILEAIASGFESRKPIIGEQWLCTSLVMAEMGNEIAHVRILEQLCNRYVPFQRCPQLALHLDHEQRVSTEIEEVVVETYVFDLQHLLPDAGDDTFQLGLRRKVRRVRRGLTFVWLGQRFSIDLAVWRQRQRLQ